jgi:DNA-binding NarL/FixJ family response regulator
MAILVLGTTPSQRDICTIGLSRPLTYAQTALLNLVAVELARAWARRQPGLISWRITQVARKNAPRKAPSPMVPILDYSNPYGLSRCEFRVCSLLGSGMSAKQIAETLHLSEATVRSHQRAIYAKTEMSGQIALLMHLKINPTAQTLMQDLSLLAA